MNRKKWFIGILILFLFGTYSIFMLLDDNYLALLTAEDGLIESAGALFFFTAAVLFLILFYKDKQGNDLFLFRTGKNIFYLLLMFLFTVAAGEEISWGQRIFNIRTPEVFEEKNVQNELNIHNLDIFHGTDKSGERKSFWGLLLNVDRLFSLFWLFFCLIIPVLVHYRPAFRKWICRINIPLVPIWIGLAFFTNYVLSKILEQLYTEKWVQSAITEVKETGFAFLFMLIGLWFLSTHKETN
ncbi:MAG: hypothetical protein JSW33_15295 [bacterium]|nr:MAG: hypothetical protein JSW33_15295 [bacterium]